MEEENTCNICIEKYNSRRTPVRCPYSCGYTACSSCIERYLIESSQEPHCMNCRREWSIIFMEKNFSHAAIGRLKKRRNYLMMVKDMSHLPEAQTILELETEHEKLKDKIEDMNSSLILLRSQIEQAYGGAKIEKEKTMVKKVKCPLEDCRGFMIRGTCGTCNKRVCMKCYKEKKDMKHNCLTEDRDNMEYMKMNTKPCPKCGIRTSKIMGCSQMWCTNEGCHTSWNWDTGAVEKGIIHNPHFFEWQRNNNGRVDRNPHDIICGGLPPTLPNSHDKHSLIQKFTIFRHIEYDARRNVEEKSNIDIRVSFLKKKINEQDYAKYIGKRDHMLRKRTAFRGLHDMFRLAATDIFQRLLQEKNPTDETLLPYAQELDRLKDYFNEQGKELCRYYKDNYGRYIYFISDNWSMIPYLEMFPEQTKKRTRQKDDKVEPVDLVSCSPSNSSDMKRRKI